jgi:serine/threonine protein phosphatase PrpC
MEDRSDLWKVGGVSIAGFSHFEEDIPCQDAHAFKVRDESRVIAAVADGAGSARLSHIGAQAFVDAVVSKIYNLPSPGEFDTQRIASEIITSVNETRDQLIRHGDDLQDGGTPSLGDFAATLIVAVADLNGGAFYHVGDGAGAAFTQISDLETTVSKPQNGEYANETYFLTMDDWEDYLRITPFDEFSDTILLMSDGVTPMAMSQGCAAPEFKNFVNPIIKFLRDNDNTTGETGVTNTLSGDNVRKITGDDKTLLWALRTPG